LKKRIGIILAIALALSMVCVASYAEEAPQPEGGGKILLEAGNGIELVYDIDV